MADKKDKDKDKDTPKGDAPDKAPKDKKKKKKKGKDGAGAPGGPSVASHPRASAAVRRAKGAGGLLSFALAAWLSHQAGLSASQVLERALPAGIAGYVLAWACAVTVWRQIVIAEVRATIELRRGAPSDPVAATRAVADAALATDPARALPAGGSDPTPAAAS